MSQIPPVTVLMPAYNAAEYISEAIDSILNQTFNDFELLIINDGSSDETASILSSYKDLRIKVITQENRGLVQSLNKGLRIAEGKYIARFDADDICYPERLQLQYDFLTQNKDYIIVGGDADYTDKNGNYIFTFESSYYEDNAIRKSDWSECPFIHSSVMFLKQSVLDAGCYNAKALTFEDHLLWKKLSRFGKMKNLHQSLIKVRFNPESATIDEKWRGKEFIAIKQKAICNEEISDADAERLKEIIRSQNFIKFKEAAYYSMIAKKYLWNRHRPSRARIYLKKAISIMPGRKEPYLLYILSFFPEKVIMGIYKTFKR
jgi:glycosyltransferase involved in cell wall biosynthesis